MTDPTNIGPRLWDGDTSTVPEAYAHYVHDPERNLLPYVEALYDCRSDSVKAKLLVGMSDELVDYIKRELDRNFSGSSVEQRASRACTLIMLLEWMVRSRLPENYRHKLHKLASQVYVASTTHRCRLGDWHSVNFRLELLAARLEIFDRNASQATAHLDKVSEEAPHIRDVGQRAWIWAELGFLYRKVGWYQRGFVWSIRACLLDEAPPHVRKKTFESLFYIDR